MEEPISITLSPTSGPPKTVHCFPSDTLRSVVAANFPRNQISLISCEIGGHHLEMDFSLAGQNVTDGSTVRVVVRPRRIHRETQRVPSAQMKRSERKQELFEENLRVTDVAFAVIECFKGAPGIYETMMRDQDMDGLQDYYYEDRPRTYGVDETPTKVSTEPLPVCWRTEDVHQPSGREVTLVVSGR